MNTGSPFCPQKRCKRIVWWFPGRLAGEYQKGRRPRKGFYKRLSPFFGGNYPLLIDFLKIHEILRRPRKISAQVLHSNFH